MIQRAIDRSRQTGGSFAVSTVVHGLALLLFSLLAGRAAYERLAPDELTEIAYIEARYGEDVAEKVKLRELPSKKPAPGPRGPGITTDSALRKPEPAAPELAPQPEMARPQLEPNLAPPPRLEPRRVEPERPQLAAAAAPDLAPAPTVPTRELAAPAQLAASLAPAPARQVIDTEKLANSLAGKLSEETAAAPRPAAPRPREDVRPRSTGLQDRGSRAPVGSEPVIAAGGAAATRGGAPIEAPAALGGGNLAARTPTTGGYAAPGAALAPAGTARGSAGGPTGIMDAAGPTGGGGGPQAGRKTILDYGTGGGGGGGGGGLVGRRARLEEPPTNRDIVAAASEPAASEPATKVVEASLDSGKGVGMTISGQIAGRKILSSRPPEYSDRARREGWEGVVSVHFTVLPDGRVKDNLYFDQTSVHRDLNQAAMAAIREFRFAPLGADQGAVEQWGVITIVFRLN